MADFQQTCLLGAHLLLCVQVVRIKPLQCLKEVAEPGASATSREENNRKASEVGASENQAGAREPSLHLNSTLQQDRGAVIHVVDPTAAGNNVARTAFRFQEIRRVCAFLLERTMGLCTGG